MSLLIFRGVSVANDKIDVSKVKGDKDAFIDKMITKVANGE